MRWDSIFLKPFTPVFSLDFSFWPNYFRYYSFVLTEYALKKYFYSFFCILLYVYRCSMKKHHLSNKIFFWEVKSRWKHTQTHTNLLKVWNIRLRVLAALNKLYAMLIEWQWSQLSVLEKHLLSSVRWTVKQDSQAKNTTSTVGHWRRVCVRDAEIAFFSLHLHW